MRAFRIGSPCVRPAVLNAAWAADGYALSYVMQDPDAIAYVAAVEAAGVTVTNAQRTAIDIFVTTGKGDGWWSSIKRLYLPIWASAAPNAIDMISLTSGTFVGAVTHAAGYVQGDGITGYFNTVNSMVSLGMSASSAMFLFLRSEVPSTSRFIAGSISNPRGYVVGRAASGFAGGEWIGNSPQGAFSSFSGAEGPGVGVFSRFDGTTYMHNRTSSTVEEGSITYADQGSISSGEAHFMALRGSTSFLSDSKFGAMGLGLGLNPTDCDNLTLATKTLWETCTGLALP